MVVRPHTWCFQCCSNKYKLRSYYHVTSHENFGRWVCDQRTEHSWAWHESITLIVPQTETPTRIFKSLNIYLFINFLGLYPNGGSVNEMRGPIQGTGLQLYVLYYTSHANIYLNIKDHLTRMSRSNTVAPVNSTN